MTTVWVPGSKSVTHRALLLAARSDVPCRVTGSLRSEDTDATLEALAQLGFDMSDDLQIVQARPSIPQSSDVIVDCGNSGTTLRLLTAQAAAWPWATKFDGDASLRRRRMAPLLDALASQGVQVQGGARAPFTVKGPLQSGTFAVDGTTSSQFTSALLLAAPFLEGTSTIRVEGIPVSQPYVDLTIRTMDSFGLHVEQEDSEYQVMGEQTPRCNAFHVPRDWSSAAFYLAAGALTDGVHIPELRRGTGQADEAMVHFLGSFGIQVEESDRGITVYPGPLTSPGSLNLRDCPDLFPILCILAACADGDTTFHGAAHLRLKESDRIQAMRDGLARVGINAHERPDGLKVLGGKMHGAPVYAYGDHRIHMAFQVANLVSSGPIQVDGKRTAAVSHPDFHINMRSFKPVRP